MENRQIFTDLSGRDTEDLQAEYGTFVVQFSGTRGMVIGKRKAESPERWGCSSAGRAPALQAGGHGFDSHHLHQNYEADAPRRVHNFAEDTETIGATPIPPGIGTMCAIENDGEAETICAHLGSDSHQRQVAVPE